MCNTSEDQQGGQHDYNTTSKQVQKVHREAGRTLKVLVRILDFILNEMKTTREFDALISSSIGCCFPSQSYYT